MDVWASPEVLECLLKLSRRAGLYQEVRKMLQEPMEKMPEYFILALSKCNIEGDCLVLDEVLSTVLPPFLAN